MPPETIKTYFFSLYCVTDENTHVHYCGTVDVDIYNKTGIEIYMAAKKLAVEDMNKQMGINEDYDNVVVKGLNPIN